MLSLFNILFPTLSGRSSPFGDALSEFCPRPHPAQEGTGWLCPGERGEMAFLRPPSVPWLLSCHGCSTAILGLHGVSLKPVAGLMPGLLPLPRQCSKSLHHLPLMSHPNGNSDYVGLQFGPQPRATPWQAH